MDPAESVKYVKADSAPVASLRVMGNIELLEDGEAQEYERALVITFESNEAIRAAIQAGRCEFQFTE
jgi:hypothetical protein